MAHREEYKAYLEEEKQNDYTQGKTWIDLDGNTNSSMGASTRPIPRPAVEIHFEKPNREIIERTKATWNEKLQNKKLTKRYAYLAFGWKGDERACLISLWTRESRFDHYARPLNAKGEPRSSAFGIAQHLGEKSRDPATQILRGLRYISHRFDTPCRANDFQRRNNYY
jgi:hypothetical protein